MYVLYVCSHARAEILYIIVSRSIYFYYKLKIISTIRL